MKNILFLVAIILIIGCKSKNDDSLNNQSILEIDTFINNFFQIYSDKPDSALNFAFSSNKWFHKNCDAINSVKSQHDSALIIMGKYCGYEYINTRSVGKSYLLKTYLVKYERQPLRFSFTFYKTDENWRLQNFRYDDSIDDELEESAKAYRILDNY